MTNKEEKIQISLMQDGIHCLVDTTKAERDEMLKLMKENPGSSQKGVELLRQARENLAKAQQSQ